MPASRFPSLLLTSTAVASIQIEQSSTPGSAIAAELPANSEESVRPASVSPACGDTIAFMSNLAVAFGGRA